MENIFPNSNILPILVIVAQLIFLEGVLSIDNAAVLGAMASTLPAHKAVPFPRPFRFLQQPTDQLLGKQRSAALKIGLLMAYVGRGLMLVLAQFIRQNPILAVIGSLYLVRLAVQNLKPGSENGETAVSGHSLANAAFWAVVLQIELVDLTLSLDNVVAAVSISSKLWVVMVGVGLGILTMRFAAGGFAWLIEREPIIETAAYIIILNLGVQLLLGTAVHLDIPIAVKFLISVVILLACLAYAHFEFVRAPLAPLLRLCGRFFAAVDKLFSWLTRPLTYLGERLLARWRQNS
ncbi:MAG: DUF475 domain-containing protein [Anaerolineales bacterium]|nr:DUF475 domain-containing protein [Anaerolineales bacterium]